ncbi:TB2/DP1, HVA22 family-domain-containing protein [Cladochytrium replicatum]|nr:TB2/DP1, HVA22 family-domain-containing protein [Cladochytrium replicatum]
MADSSVQKQITDKAQYYLAQFDKELSKLPWAVELEKRTQVSKTYIVGGAGIVVFILIFFNVWGDLLTDLIGFVYPAYASFKAIESSAKEDDTQWLTYWTVFGFLNLIEFFTDFILYWAPFYHTFKALFLLYLFLPQFRGASFLYTRFIRPTLIQNQSQIDSAINKAKVR